MAQVFVWKAYGNVRVYAADTTRELQSLLDVVYTVALQNIYDEGHDKVKRTYDKNKDTKVKGLIKYLIEQVGENCDSFEAGTGFYEVTEAGT